MCEHCKAQLSWKACVCIILGLYTCMCMSATCEVLQLYKMALQTLVSMLFCLHSFLPIKEGRKKNLGSGWYISHLKRLIVFQWKHRPQQNITHEMLLRTSPMRCAVCITHVLCASLMRCCCVHHSWDLAVCIHEMFLCAKHHSRVFAVYMQVWPVWSVCFAPQPRRSCLRRHS